MPLELSRWPLAPALVFAFAAAGCAQVHRTAIGERLATPNTRYGHAVDARAQSIGVDSESIGKSGGRALSNTGSSTGRQLAQVIALVTWATSQSPRTGNATMTDDWADPVTQSLREQCPNGVLTGLQTVRESESYPWFSAEVVHVTGYCAPSAKGELLHASK